MPSPLAHLLLPPLILLVAAVGATYVYAASDAVRTQPGHGLHVDAHGAMQPGHGQAMQPAHEHVRLHPLSEMAANLKHVLVQPLPHIQLLVNATVFRGDGDVVNVSWAGVLYPTAADIIGLYVPAHAHPAAVVPVQFVKCIDANPDYLTDGQGWATFRLVNHRQSFGFKFIKHGFLTPLIVADSPPISNAVPERPESGHLTVNADEGYVTVQWVSSRGDQQQVQFRPLDAVDGVESVEGTKSVTTEVVESVAETMTPADMCGFPADSAGWLDPGFIHTAVLRLPDGLAADARVAYRYGSQATGWSEWATLRVPPAVGDASAPPLRFLAFNDVAMSNALLFNNKCPPWCPPGLSFADGYGTNSSKLPRWLEAEDAHVALMIGDLAYALGFAADWDFFGAQFERAFTRWPLAVGMGNHERDWPGSDDAFNGSASDSGGECGVPTVVRFSTPAHGPGGSCAAASEAATPGAGGPGPRVARAGPRACGRSAGGGAPGLFYSFERGPVHFIVLDSEVPSARGSLQSAFVVADLAGVDRARTPWIVVGLHRMMWAPATYRHAPTGDLDSMERLQEDFEELFLQYEVDVVIQGHEHAYARTCMLAAGSCIEPPAGAYLHRPTLGSLASSGAAEGGPSTGTEAQGGASSAAEVLESSLPGASAAEGGAPAGAGKRGRSDDAGAGEAPSTASTGAMEGASSAGAVEGASVARAEQGSASALGRTRAPAASRRALASTRAAGSARIAAAGQKRGAKAQGAAAGGNGGSGRGGGGTRRGPAAPARAPVYVLAGHAGAGFTHGFPRTLPDWVVVGFEERNGYLRFAASFSSLSMEAVSSDDGSTMDAFELRR